jgi:hypothetical protein
MSASDVLRMNRWLLNVAAITAVSKPKVMSASILGTSGY